MCDAVERDSVVMENFDIDDGGPPTWTVTQCYYRKNDQNFETKPAAVPARTLSSTVAILVFSLLINSVNAHYTPQWAVRIKGGDLVADQIAAKHGFINRGKIFEEYYHFEHKAVRKRSLEPDETYHKNLIEQPEVVWAQQQVVKRRTKRDSIPFRPRQKADTLRFSDVKWPQMWYLNRGQGLDMNVLPAWQEGISGKGVVVTILDDGLEKNHPDIIKNYDPQASYDVNNHDEDPMPRYDLIDSNRHGTRCAGEVAAVANNTLCSVGVAFGASVGGVRMLDGDVTDAVEARSLSLNPQHIDIYSASWGPDDDGKTVDGPGELATRAFMEGVLKGRQGKGSIFVWASGNGGRDHDNCNCDGYTNSIWTLSISSATEQGLVPWYSEACSSTLATTYSSGSAGEKQIVTTDLHHGCTSTHTGTSASAPLAAGICALALEANRDLTWRDMQHIVVRTARPDNLKSPDWKINGVGRNVSHSFGYGLMDASAMVGLARTWKTVPEQNRCEVSAPHVDKHIPARSKVILNLTVTECPGVNFLEHVQAKISLSSSRRGDLQIYLTSPAGTRCTLLAKRPQDSSRNPFVSWPFMSVHTWGEMPFGIWQLEIHNEGKFLGLATLQEWSLLLYGTAQMPEGSSPPRSSIPNLPPKISPPAASRKKPKLKSYTRPITLNPQFATTNLPLTIFLGPGNASQPYKVPAIFQGYPKVQQLFPVYVNTRKSQEHFAKSMLVQKAERQDPGSNVTSRPNKARKPSSRNQSKTKALRKKNNQGLLRGSSSTGNFDAWQMVFYGTEEAPAADGKTSFTPNVPNSFGALTPDISVEPDINNNLDGGTHWKDPRHERQRTTTEGSGSPLSLSSASSSGCKSHLDQQSPLCIECLPGLHLTNGWCEPNCPAKTYPGLNAWNRSECLPCHYTCLTCTGDEPYQCTACFDDAQSVTHSVVDRAVTKKILLPPESRSTFACYPTLLLNKANANGWYYWSAIFFSCNMVLLFVLIWWLCQNGGRLRPRKRATNGYRYVKDIRAEVDGIVENSSSSSEEDAEEISINKREQY